MNDQPDNKPIPKPTIKQRKFVKRYIETGNATQSAFETYSAKNKNVASTIAVDNLKKPAVQNELKRALRKAGLTEDSTSEALQEIIQQGLKSKTARAGDVLQAVKLYHQLEGNLGKHKERRSAELIIHGKTTKDNLLKLKKTYDDFWNE